MARERPKRWGDMFGLDFEADASMSLGERKQMHRGNQKKSRVSENRESSFEKVTGRFRGSDGQFEPGSPPPDLDQSANRYRGKDGRFKRRSSDLYDERAEVRLDSLDPEG